MNTMWGLGRGGHEFFYLGLWELQPDWTYLESLAKGHV